MKNLENQVDVIYSMVSQLRVSGDAVDVVAAVRSKLRKLWDDVKKLPETPEAVESEKEADADGGQDNG